MLDNSQSSGSIRIRTRLVYILNSIYSIKKGNWSETLHLLRTSQYFVLCQVELVFPSKQGFVTKGLFWFLRSSLAKVARQRLRNQHKQTTFLFFWITNHTWFRILLPISNHLPTFKFWRALLFVELDLQFLYIQNSNVLPKMNKRHSLKISNL